MENDRYPKEDLGRLLKSGIGDGESSTMVRSFNRLLVILFLGSSTIVALLPLLDRIRSTRRPWSPGLVGEAGLLICAALLVTAGFYFLLKKLTPFLDANALAQARFLDAWDPKYIDVAILFSAAVSLFLELAIIRWQSTVFEFFAFYKNFSLLACFIGLGIGYALAMRDRIPLLLVIPLLAGQFGFMIVVRFAPAVPPRAQPFREQLAMGLGVADFTSTAAVYALLTVVFLSTALVFIPVGQLCGRLMEHRKKLRAYGLNLLGSLLGVLIMLLASVLWTPPLAWFALCFLAILLFHLGVPTLRRHTTSRKSMTYTL